MNKTRLAIVVVDAPATIADILNTLKQEELDADVFHTAEQFFGQASLPDCACLILGIDLHTPAGRRAQESWLGAPSRPPMIFVGANMDERCIGAAIDLDCIAVFDTPIAPSALLRAIHAALNM